MLDFSQCKLEKIVVHFVGNKHREESTQLSKSETPINDELNEHLTKYFISHIKPDASYYFDTAPESGINQAFNCVQTIFGDYTQLVPQSVELAKHLYECSVHPKIRSGEFFAVLIRDCVVDDELVDAIGLFKSEVKENFLKVLPSNGTYTIISDSGININKLDKGCLIFNTEAQTGYRILIVDNINKAVEAEFWRDMFLQIMPRNDQFYQTQNFLNLCKGYVEDVYNEENNVSKPQQIEMLNKTVNFFKENDQFKLDEFEQDVMMGESNSIQAFNEYKKFYEEQNDVKLNDEFDISEDAVKNGKRKFKSVLKLDRNFHVYIHGDRENIERGFDSERKLNYYKLYFEEEV